MPAEAAGIPVLTLPMRGSMDFASILDSFKPKQGRSATRKNLGLSESDCVILMAGIKYAHASLLAFYHPQRTETFLPQAGRVENQFSFWPVYGEKFAGQSAIFVSDSEEIPAQLQTEFATMERIKTTESMHRGCPVKKFYLSLCRGLRGNSPGLLPTHGME